ncbi:hypothetical protein MUK42_20621 [Musa troglodytarum]|uniref:Uncharacterized protein n=1 Tax=Musa troglodytarum TaxID=320322 RepID=A0A9E7ERE6_9LILI|nr:hypothetical protein MUK42_20621 [Musa troglodytarum]
MGGKEWAAEFQQGEIWKRAGAMGRGSEIAGGSLEQKVEESKGWQIEPEAYEKRRLPQIFSVLTLMREDRRRSRRRDQAGISLRQRLAQLKMSKKKTGIIGSVGTFVGPDACPTDGDRDENSFLGGYQSGG